METCTPRPPPTRHLKGRKGRKARPLPSPWSLSAKCSSSVFLDTIKSCGRKEEGEGEEEEEEEEVEEEEVEEEEVEEEEEETGNSASCARFAHAPQIEPRFV